MDNKELNRLSVKLSFAIEEALEQNECVCQDAKIVLAALTAVIGIRLRKEHSKLSVAQSDQMAVEIIAKRVVKNHINFNRNERQRLIQGN